MAPEKEPRKNDLAGYGKHWDDIEKQEQQRREAEEARQRQEETGSQAAQAAEREQNRLPSDGCFPWERQRREGRGADPVQQHGRTPNDETFTRPGDMNADGYHPPRRQPSPPHTYDPPPSQSHGALPSRPSPSEVLPPFPIQFDNSGQSLKAKSK